MKQQTIEKIMVAYNELVNTNSDISSRILADKANTSLRNAQEFLRNLKSESDKSESVESESVSVSDKSVSDKSVSDKSESDKSESVKTESVKTESISESNKTESESIESESVSKQKINVETGEGYVQQLNLLYKEGIISKEEYIEDVIRSNRNYPNFLPKQFLQKFFEKITNNSTKY